MAEVNQELAPERLFKRLENIHLRFPVEQTYKALCDCSSELYKVIGPDGMDRSALHRHLTVALGIEESQLIHAESKRPLSTLQLLSLAEQTLRAGGSLTTAIRKVGELRIDADNKVLSKDSDPANYSDRFSNLCADLVVGLAAFKSALEARRNDT
jgi:DNA-binding transcriptional ArsR family regulator